MGQLPDLNSIQLLISRQNLSTDNASLTLIHALFFSLTVEILKNIPHECCPVSIIIITVIMNVEIVVLNRQTRLLIIVSKITSI